MKLIEQRKELYFVAIWLHKGNTQNINKKMIDKGYSSFIESYLNILRLSFWASKEFDLKAIYKLSRCKILIKFSIWVDGVQNKNCDLRYFLVSSTPDKIQKFYFSADSNTITSLSFYFNRLRVAATKAISIFTIWLLEISDT